jgi:hypothetical protein
MWDPFLDRHLEHAGENDCQHWEVPGAVLSVLDALIDGLLCRHNATR